MKRVLIVEDDPLISRMYQRVFQFEGFETDMARDGEEGLHLLKQNTPVMILLDIMMPKLSGIDVLKAIKIDPRYRDIPVVVLTNLSGSEDAEHAIELGAVKYLVKSNTKPSQIVKEINEILAASTRDAVPKSAKS
jgi:CheY-like chemotaxis protein